MILLADGSGVNLRIDSQIVWIGEIDGGTTASVVSVNNTSVGHPVQAAGDNSRPTVGRAIMRKLSYAGFAGVHCVFSVGQTGSV